MTAGLVSAAGGCETARSASSALSFSCSSPVNFCRSLTCCINSKIAGSVTALLSVLAGCEPGELDSCPQIDPPSNKTATTVFRIRSIDVLSRGRTPHVLLQKKTFRRRRRRQGGPCLTFGNLKDCIALLRDAAGVRAMTPTRDGTRLPPKERVQSCLMPQPATVWTNPLAAF